MASSVDKKLVMSLDDIIVDSRPNQRQKKTSRYSSAPRGSEGVTGSSTSYDQQYKKNDYYYNNSSESDWDWDSSKKSSWKESTDSGYNKYEYQYNKSKSNNYNNSQQQTQQYPDFKMSLETKASKNTVVSYTKDGSLKVTLYQTDVCTFRKKSYVLELNTGGYRTLETKFVINQCLAMFNAMIIEQRKRSSSESDSPRDLDTLLSMSLDQAAHKLKRIKLNTFGSMLGKNTTSRISQNDKDNNESHVTVTDTVTVQDKVNDLDNKIIGNNTESEPDSNTGNKKLGEEQQQQNQIQTATVDNFNDDNANIIVEDNHNLILNNDNDHEVVDFEIKDELDSEEKSTRSLVLKEGIHNMIPTDQDEDALSARKAFLTQRLEHLKKIKEQQIQNQIQLQLQQQQQEQVTHDQESQQQTKTQPVQTSDNHSSSNTKSTSIVASIAMQAQDEAKVIIAQQRSQQQSSLSFSAKKTELQKKFERLQRKINGEEPDSDAAVETQNQVQNSKEANKSPKSEIQVLASSSQQYGYQTTPLKLINNNDSNLDFNSKWKVKIFNKESNDYDVIDFFDGMQLSAGYFVVSVLKQKLEEKFKSYTQFQYQDYNYQSYSNDRSQTLNYGSIQQYNSSNANTNNQYQMQQNYNQQYYQNYQNTVTVAPLSQTVTNGLNSVGSGVNTVSSSTVQNIGNVYSQTYQIQPQPQTTMVQIGDHYYRAVPATSYNVSNANSTSKVQLVRPVAVNQVTLTSPRKINIKTKDPEPFEFQ